MDDGWFARKRSEKSRKPMLAHYLRDGRPVCRQNEVWEDPVLAPESEAKGRCDVCLNRLSVKTEPAPPAVEVGNVYELWTRLARVDKEYRPRRYIVEKVDGTIAWVRLSSAANRPVSHRGPHFVGVDRIQRLWTLVAKETAYAGIRDGIRDGSADDVAAGVPLDEGA